MEKLRALADPKLARRSIRAAARKGVKVWLDAARSKAKRIDDPESAADISANLAIRESGREGRKLDAVVMRVGVKGGARPSNKDPKDTGHWRHVEMGTSDTPAQPFMRPTISENIDTATRAVVAELGPQIEKQMRKRR